MKLRNFTKRKQQFLKVVLIMAIIIGVRLPVGAQVTIGSDNPPHKESLLDLKEDAGGNSSRGFLLPRVNLRATDDPTPLSEHVEGMFVYNLATSDAGSKTIKPGIYYNTGKKWEKANSIFTNWFYMPSVVFDTSSTGEMTKDLYQLYVDQFNTPKFRSANAPSFISYVPEAEDIYYYITYYDEEVFEILSLSEKGELKYKIKEAASESTLINIIFVLK